MSDDPQRWRRFADCKGRTPLFYDSSPVAQVVAVAVCMTCGVRGACLADALTTEAATPAGPFGIRGGLAANQRRRLARQLAAQPVTVSVPATSGRRAWPQRELAAMA